MRRGSFTAQRIAQSVSHHTVKPRPRPTLADFQAHVFDLTYRSRETGTTTSFPVLALDADHAETLGGIRLAALGVEASELDLDVCKQRAETSAEALEGLLVAEELDEYMDRQRLFDRRGERSTLSGSADSWTGPIAENH